MPKRGRSNLQGKRDAKRNKLTRKNESEEKRHQRLARQRECASSRRANESEHEYRQRLAEQRYYASSRRAKKSEEERRQRLAELIDCVLAQRANESEEKPHQRRFGSSRRAKKSKAKRSRKDNITINLWKFSGTTRQANHSSITMRNQRKHPSLPTSLELSRDWTAPRTVYGQKASATETNLCNNSVIECPPPEEEITIIESYSPVKDEFETDNVETYIGPQNVNVPACREIKQEPAFEDLTPNVEYFRIAQKMQEDHRYLLPEVVEEYCDDEISFEPCDKDKSSSPLSVTSEDRTYTPIGRSRMLKEKYSLFRTESGANQERTAPLLRQEEILQPEQTKSRGRYGARSKKNSSTH